MAELDEQREQRLAKLARLRARGIDPYPHRFQRTNTAAEALAIFERFESTPPPDLADSLVTPDVSVAGRIVAIRGMGRATFAHIQDGSGRIQILFRRDVLGDEKYAELKDYDLGDFVGVDGRMIRTRTGEISVEAEDFAMLSKALRPPPEKWHGLTDVEKRYRQRYLDLIASADARRTFAQRSRIVAKIRQFLNDQGFLEVETPVLHPTVGGAAARPFVTFHNALDRHLFLRISLELHLKRILIGGFEKIYEIGRVFRNEGISTTHNPEFTMLESYEAYADYYSVMQMVEELVGFVASEVHGTTKIIYAGQPIDLTPPWPRLTLRDAIREHSGIDYYDYPDLESLRGAAEVAGVAIDPRVGRGKIIDELLTAFVQPKLIQPTFLIDYPVELSPLAKKKADDPRLVERFEAFVAGMEIANAFSELNDPVDQRERFEAQVALRAAGDEEAELLDDDFLVAIEHGMPPAGGLGIGIDRLVMLLTDQQSIREVILFPTLRG